MKYIQYHLIEIQLRLFYITFSAICTFFLCYNFQIEIVYIMGKPFIDLQQTFVFLELTEAFYTLLKISTILSLFFLIPLIFYHIWCFFIPSFYNLERNRINFYFILIFFLFIIEVFFTYFFVLPKICHFLIGFEMSSEVSKSAVQTDPIISIEFTAQIGSYVGLIFKILSTILFLFQIPLCICFLYSKKILYVSSLYNNRKLLGLISLFFSALIVPPEIASQLAVAFFFYLIFEFLIFIGLFFE